MLASAMSYEEDKSNLLTQCTCVNSTMYSTSYMPGLVMDAASPQSVQ